MTRAGTWFLLGAIGIAFVIYVLIWATLACSSTAWQTLMDGSPSCGEFWLNRYQGLLGAIATLLAGFLAYRAAVAEARQADTRSRNTQKAMLNGRVEELCRDIDALKVAAAYIRTYLENYPAAPDQPAGGIYYDRYMEARIKGRDFISQSALAAPNGFGGRIQTVMTALDRIGERIKEHIGASGSNYHSSVAMFSAEIKRNIDGLGILEKQIRNEIPRFETRLNNVRDELDTL
jgi:hypothetical protein